MDPGTAVVLGATVTSLGGVAVAVIGAVFSAERSKLIRERDEALAKVASLEKTAGGGSDADS